jgi:hypothetical protein
VPVIACGYFRGTMSSSSFVSPNDEETILERGSDRNFPPHQESIITYPREVLDIIR